MEKIELSPTEAVTALGWKKNKVYYWINTGKFEIVERLDGQKIVLSQEDFQRLKKSQNSESFESFENVSNNLKESEKVLNSSDLNETKVYKNDLKSLNSEQMEFMQTALETIKQMHQTSLNNYAYSVKLLTDGKNDLEGENFQLKADIKTAEEKLKKSESEKIELIKKFESEKNEQIKKFEKLQKFWFFIIKVLICLIVSGIILFCFNSNSLKHSDLGKKEQVIQEVQPKIEQPAQPAIRKSAPTGRK
ncbi:MAG: hypothetical protein NC408_04570 [Candidatus Gastranaerophilales bacterium]|nr:hypothetical protein [Candidatus Gastranaerophilales bacterium]MCM1072254.1 hypothetical protein [Bacteroides sp.]